MSGSTTGTVWAVDIGINSLKALQLQYLGNRVEVVGFANIRHGKILSGGGMSTDERNELIALSLRKFVSENQVDNIPMIISVPSQNTFARFVKLPPVEKKRIPEIIEFEAAQQIPFDINDVQWDWQLMEEEGGETKVGLFAIKNEVVTSSLEHFEREKIRVGFVQMSPMALYNYLVYDRGELVRSDKEATVVLNIGAENTDLVVCTKSGVWQRCISMGGNNFTEAIAKAFKLNFEKAEKLKRTAAMSKYARQILQAMKPVFSDLSSEIQRSIGFYSSGNPNVKLTKIIAFGGGTRMRGLVKYLQQSLQIPIEQPESFKRLSTGAGVSAAQFHENVFDFGVVYGLGLQGLGLGKIESNLLPRRIARSMEWAAKTKYFLLAACMLLLAAILGFVRTTVDKIAYDKNDDVRQEITRVISKAKRAASAVSSEESKGPISEATIQKAFKPFENRKMLPLVYQTVFSLLPNAKNNPAQASLYDAFLMGDVGTVLDVPRKERKQLFITSMSIYYTTSVENSDFGDMDFESGRGKGGGSDDMMMDEMMMMGMEQPQFAKITYGAEPGAAAEGEGGGAGFVISLVGYSPYKNVEELIDPVGVDDDQSKWGLVTRLTNLDEIFDGNSPFSLYKKTDVKHCKIEVKLVELETEIPTGIGIGSTRMKKGSSSGGRYGGGATGEEVEEQILIDPMTKEVINKVAELDDRGFEKTDKLGKVVYQKNDHWFRFDFKLVWKNAPAAASTTEGY